jgi:hypothetical protein
MVEESVLRFNKEYAIGLVCIAVATTVLLITPSFPEGQADVNLTGPAFFPNIISYFLIIFGVIQLITGFSIAIRVTNATPGVGADQVVEQKLPLKRIFLFLGLIFGFVLFFEPLGFFITTFTFLVLLMRLFELDFLRCMLYGALFTVVIYLMFGVLFTIGLPAGILGFLGL